MRPQWRPRTSRVVCLIPQILPVREGLERRSSGPGAPTGLHIIKKEVLLVRDKHAIAWVAERWWGVVVAGQDPCWPSAPENIQNRKTDSIGRPIASNYYRRHIATRSGVRLAPHTAEERLYSPVLHYRTSYQYQAYYKGRLQRLFVCSLPDVPRSGSISPVQRFQSEDTYSMVMEVLLSTKLKLSTIRLSMCHFGRRSSPLVADSKL